MDRWMQWIQWADGEMYGRATGEMQGVECKRGGTCHLERFCHTSTLLLDLVVLPVVKIAV